MTDSYVQAERDLCVAEDRLASAKASGDARRIEEAESDYEDAVAEVRRHENRIDSLMERERN